MNNGYVKIFFPVMFLIVIQEGNDSNNYPFSNSIER